MEGGSDMTIDYIFSMLNDFQVIAEVAEARELIIILDYYTEQGTIPSDENLRLKEMVLSPDKENREVVKEILKVKYNLL